MRIIFLNIWKDKIKYNLDDFLNKELKTTDVFCFQEAIDNDGLVGKELNKDFLRISSNKSITKDLYFNIATFINKNFKVIETTELLKTEIDLGLGLHTKISGDNSGTYNIINIHGTAFPVDKNDTNSRIEQSEKIINFASKLEGTVIIGGDFNLNPNTQSVKMFEHNGYINLIDKNNIKTTRNKHSWDRFSNNKMFYSDYVFAKTKASNIKLEVPFIEVSDHLPMIVTM